MKYIALSLLALFAWLADYSLAMQDMASNKDVNTFIEKKLKEYKSPKPMSQAQAMYEVWNISPSEIDKPINLWGNK